MMTYVVGQEIAYGRWGNWGLMDHGFSTIAKINGHGHVHLTNGLMFDKHGHERNANWGGKSLVEVETVRRQLAHRKEIHDRRVIVEEILNQIAGRKTGHGEYVEFSDELKMMLCDKINRL